MPADKRTRSQGRKLRSGLTLSLLSTTALAITVPAFSDTVIVESDDQPIYVSVAGENGDKGESRHGNHNGRSGGPGGQSDDVEVSLTGDIETTDEYGQIVFVETLGGSGGHGGHGGRHGGYGGAGGDAGDISLNVAEGVKLKTSGRYATGIYLYAKGGYGGDAGGSGTYSGRSGGMGGKGGMIHAVLHGDLHTTGDTSRGVFLITEGGLGGDGGGNGGLSGHGGDGGDGGAGGGDVRADLYGSIITEGSHSAAIHALSVGGNGGNGGSSLQAFYAVGGNGGKGGIGRNIDILLDGQIKTLGNGSDGILAQSIGGGGGRGGNAAEVGVIVGVAIGGKGGAGARAGDVNISLGEDARIDTHGRLSTGIMAQSIGGGGGSGGSATGVTVGTVASAQFSIGGKGGTGGHAGDINIDLAHGSRIETGKPLDDDQEGSAHLNDHSAGVVAQAIGGGGGHGGSALSVSAAANPDGPSLALAFSYGGSGGSGGAGGNVVVTSGADIKTHGRNSTGVLAQSVGGGGGHGGNTISVAASGGELAASVGLAFGGSGAEGGNGGSVSVTNSGTITTSAALSDALIAQSIGGGGGNGGNAIDVSVAVGEAAYAANIAMGGKSGGGGNGGDVSAINTGHISTSGDHSIGALVQSIGGGGGNGGNAYSFSAAIGTGSGEDGGKATNINLAFGGSGGHGGHGGAIDFTQAGTIETSGALSSAIKIQSIGGGGGNGGNVIAGTLTSTNGAASEDNEAAQTRSLTIALGGTGGSGGAGGKIDARLDAGSLTQTAGVFSHGAHIQSIGGGGGSGGYAETISISKEQSGGEDGGDEESDEEPEGKVTNLALAIGGRGGNGGAGGDISAEIDGTAVITTTGVGARGLLVQSIGGGGGDGGHAHAYGRLSGGNDDSRDERINIGGNGGNGNDGGDVTLTETGDGLSGYIETSGNGAHGIQAQSIGSGGGTGGSTGSILEFAGYDFAEFSTDDLQPSDEDLEGGNEEPDYEISAGSNGGVGAGGTVSVTRSALVSTTGTGATAILAQSIGAGGGDAYHGGVTLSVSNHNFTFGAKSNAHGDGGDVTITSGGEVATAGDGSAALMAQSIGGGGGNGVTFAAEADQSLTIVSGLGSNHSLGNGGTTKISQTGLVSTLGEQSFGLIAQSIGGGGGSSYYGRKSSPSASVTYQLGGDNVAKGKGGAVNVTASAIETDGNQSSAVLAQSMSAGGGFASLHGGQFVEFKGDFQLGASLHSQYVSGDVSLTMGGDIITNGNQSVGLIGQSIGGGGGLMQLGHVSADRAELSVQLGSTGNSRGTGGAVSLALDGDVGTRGDQSHGVLLQSVGVGGGALFLDGFDADTEASLTARIGGSYVDNSGDINAVLGGSIHTLGSQSFGMIAQSIGGGGGLIGLLDSGDMTSPLALDFQLNRKTGSGAIDISTKAESLVYTEGDKAVGVFAQTGIGSSLILLDDTHAEAGDDPTPNTNALTGDINLQFDGDILTKGDHATAVMAASTRGSVALVQNDAGFHFIGETADGQSGRIAIAQSGDMLTYGEGAHGIDAFTDRSSDKAISLAISGVIETRGGETHAIRTRNAPFNIDDPGKISSKVLTDIDIEEGARILALGETRDSAAIDVTEAYGQFNLTISGRVQRATSGYDGEALAIRTSGRGLVNITETGEVLGSLFADDRSYNLSIGGLLDGWVNGADSYSLLENGQHFIPLGADGFKSGIDVREIALLEGELHPYLASFSNLNQPITVITAENGLPDTITSNIVVPAALNFGLETRSTDDNASEELVITSVQTRFDDLLTGSAAPLGQLVDSATSAWIGGQEVTDNDKLLYATLLSAANISTAQGVQDFFGSHFDLSVTNAMVVNQHASAVRHVNNIHSCGASEGSWAAITETECNWSRLTGTFSKNSSLSSKANAYDLSFGRQIALSPTMRFGWGAGYGTETFKTDTATSETERWHVGGVLKFTEGPNLGSAAISLSYAQIDRERVSGLGTAAHIVSADQEALSASGRLRGAHLFRLGSFDLTAITDLNVSYIHDFGYEEQGAEWVAFGVEEQGQFLVELHPSLRLGRDFRVSDTVLRPWVGLGARYSTHEAEMRQTFVGTSFDDQNVTLRTSGDEVLASVQFGLDILSSDWFELKLVADGAYGDATRSESLSAKFAYRF